MRSATSRVPGLARILSCTLALGCAALLGLPTFASAGTILTFGQVTPVDEVVATFSGNSATLTTVGVSNPAVSTTSTPILVTQVGTVLIPTGLPAWETFLTPGLTSSTPQVGDAKDGFSGTIIISALHDGRGTNILTASFHGNGILNALGGSASLRVPGNVTFTSTFPAIEALLAGTIGGNLALSFTNVLPPQGVLPGVPFTNFTAQNSGLFATIIPEPASIVMAVFGLLGVLGYGPLRHKYGRFRQKSSKA